MFSITGTSGNMDTNDQCFQRKIYKLLAFHIHDCKNYWRTKTSIQNNTSMENWLMVNIGRWQDCCCVLSDWKILPFNWKTIHNWSIVHSIWLIFQESIPNVDPLNPENLSGVTMGVCTFYIILYPYHSQTRCFISWGWHLLASLGSGVSGLASPFFSSHSGLAAVENNAKQIGQVDQQNPWNNQYILSGRLIQRPWKNKFVSTKLIAILNKKTIDQHAWLILGQPPTRNLRTGWMRRRSHRAWDSRWAGIIFCDGETLC